MPAELIAGACEMWTGFDISIVARNYAQLAGLLAGFAFVVINLVLDRAYRRRSDGPPDRREVAHETLTGIALMNAFLGLFLTAVQYSLLAGEQGCAVTGGRATSAELLGGISFVASLYVLLYAIVQFVSGGDGALIRHCVFIVAVLVPPIAVFFVEATLTDLALALGDPQSRRPLQPLWDDANRLSLPITGAIAVICALAWLRGRRRRRSDISIGPVAARIRTVFPYLSTVVIIAAIMRSMSALPKTDVASHLSSAEAWLWVAVFAALMLVQSMALSFQRGVESPCRPAPKVAATENA
ncbi:hypothetical protein [Mycolicibacter arupensis]|uniref:ABC transporter permease n=2 Tax=Mycolicibacter arupensis TaxID=342002 RepID=A0ABX3RS63_9MYCO|nr:hypothetical protein [Mycolicibacter arupensis]MCV7276716.1 hypothetical protein [Mycolicibacter arupensis]OQZ96541.1 hypothetical protein BST15_12160 [Mycolicibacter arupensis]